MHVLFDVSLSLSIKLCYDSLLVQNNYMIQSLQLSSVQCCVAEGLVCFGSTSTYMVSVVLHVRVPILYSIMYARMRTRVHAYVVKYK